MPKYEITAPDGRTLIIEGPRTPTQEDAKRLFEQYKVESQPKVDSQQAMDAALNDLAQQQSPAQAALISAGKGFADILRGIGLMDEADETEKKAFEALKKASPISSTAGEIVGQAAPFIATGGPLVAGVAGAGGRVAASAGLGAIEGGIIAKGQGEDVDRGALTGAAFGAGGQAIGEGIDLARRAMTPSPANAAVEYAESRGLPLMTTDVVPPQGAASKMVRSIGEQVPIVGTSGNRAAQQAARIEEVESLRALYPEVTDDAIYKSFESSGNKYKQAINKRYNEIGSVMGDTTIPISKTESAILNQLQELKSGGRIQDTETINKLEKVLGDLMSGEQTYKSMRDNRTFIRETLRSEMPSTQADRVIEDVYNAMTEDITSAVAKTAGDDAAKKLKQVDQIYAIEKNVQKKTKLKNILAKGDVKPEEATKAVFSSDLSDVKQAYSALDNAGRANVRAAIVNRMLSDAVGSGAEASPERFLSAMKRYEKQFGVFFKGAERKQLEGLRAYLDATRRAPQAAFDPTTGAKMIPYALTGGVASDAAGVTGGLVTGSFATIAGMSRLYESRPVRNAMIRLANTPKSGESYQKAVNAVNSAIISQQANQDDDR